LGWGVNNETIRLISYYCKELEELEIGCGGNISNLCLLLACRKLKIFRAFQTLTTSDLI